MTTIDDSKAKTILLLFKREEHYGRGDDCQYFPSGSKIESVPLDPGERVYGIYKDKYLFTPLSFIIKTERGFERVRWDSIVHCSSKYGLVEEKEKAKLTLVDGSTVTVQVSDLGTGWGGRISQLFHRMIEKWGARATFGHPPLSIEDFFAVDNADFAPNLGPPPFREQKRTALLALRDRAEIEDVLVHVEIEDDGLVSDIIIIRTPCASLDVSDFVKEYKADGIGDAPEEILRFFPPGGHLYTKTIIWD